MEASARYDWLKARQSGIGGSDVGAILGLNPFKTPLQVYEEKTAQEPIETPMNPAMEFGLRLEPVIAEKYTDETGLKVKNRRKMLRDKEYPFMLANIDRYIENPFGDTGLLEIKTASGWAARMWEDRIPEYYYTQVQHYLRVTGYQWADVAILIDGRDFRIEHVKRSEDFVGAMIEQEDRFWNYHVLKRIPPEPVNAEDVQRMFPDSDPSLRVQATPAALEVVRTLRDLKDEKKRIEAAICDQEDRIKLLLGEAEVLEHDGAPVATWKTIVSARFDSKAFKADHPDIFPAYTKESKYRRFTLK